MSATIIKALLSLNAAVKTSLFGVYFKRIIAISLPISCSRIVYLVGGFVAMFMLGRLGKSSLAAGILAIPTYSVVILFATAIFQAMSILIYQTPRDQRTPHFFTQLLQTNLSLAGMIGLIASILLWHADKLLLLTHQDPVLIAMTRPYFHLVALSIIPGLLTTVINQLAIGLGKASSLLLIEVISFIPKILLCYGFIFGMSGIPAMGLAGIALAEFIVKSSILFGLIARFKYSKFYKANTTDFQWHAWVNWPRHALIVKIGLPIAAQSSGELAAISVSTYFMGYFGTSALAALSITNQYMIPALMLAYGLSQSLTILINDMHDEARFNQNLKACLWAAACIMFIYAFPFMVIFFCYSSQLLVLFAPASINDPLLLSYGYLFFIISITFMLVDGIRQIAIGSLRALIGTRKVVWSSLGIIWFIALPCSLIIAFTMHGGAVGLRVGFVVGMAISAIVLCQKILTTMTYHHKAMILRT